MTLSTPASMRTLRVHTYGPPLEVLRLEEVPVPSPDANRIRVRVNACALNPADWAVCQGFLPAPPPRGIGFDVSGTVDALGEGVTGVSLGDLVFGVPDLRGYSTGGASDYAVLAVWAPVPKGLDLLDAAALPMAVETAVRSIDLLGLSAGQTIMINGGGTMTGFAAVQIALLRGAHVIVSAGDAFADRLRALGAKVTPYGEGMVERVGEIAGGPTDWALHTALAKGVLPDLIKIVGGEPSRVMSFSDSMKTAWACERQGGSRAWFIAMTRSAPTRSWLRTAASPFRSPALSPWKIGARLPRSAWAGEPTASCCFCSTTLLRRTANRARHGRAGSVWIDQTFVGG
jgi:D-arabinose 1-dehydrogenase-like Zn-dependent alcohol dehydrogenase